MISDRQSSAREDVPMRRWARVFAAAATVARRSMHRGGRNLISLATAGVALVALSACRVDSTVDVAIEANGSGTVTVTLTADHELVAAVPDLADQLRRDDLAAAGWEVTPLTPTNDGGATVVLTHPFTTPDEATAILGSMSGTNGPFGNLAIRQQTAFAKVNTSVSGAIRMPLGTSTFVDDGLVARIGTHPPIDAGLAARGLTLADAFTLKLAITVPGRAEVSTGIVLRPEGSGFDTRTRVEWTADLKGAAATSDGQPISIEARLSDPAARTADRVRAFAPWALAAWGAFFLLVLIPLWGLLQRRRRRR